MYSNLPVLGVGMGFRHPYIGDIFQHQQNIDFLEIIADHYIDPTPEKKHELELLKSHFTLIPHGINLSLGSAAGVDPAYLEKLAQLIEDVSPPWWSEHICFTQAEGIDIGHLSPMPFTQESIDVFQRNMEVVRQYIQCPLILENITYLVKLPGTMNEVEFVSRVVEACDCGLLLDITNIYTNCTNYKYSPQDYLDQLPQERIVQLHFVGGHWDGDVLIDSHSQQTPQQVWEIMEKVFKIAPVKGAILERDENLPPFSEILQELETAKNLGKNYQRWK